MTFGHDLRAGKGLPVYSRPSWAGGDGVESRGFWSDLVGSRGGIKGPRIWNTKENAWNAKAENPSPNRDERPPFPKRSQLDRSFESPRLTISERTKSTSIRDDDDVDDEDGEDGDDSFTTS